MSSSQSVCSVDALGGSWWPDCSSVGNTTELTPQQSMYQSKRITTPTPKFTILSLPRSHGHLPVRGQGRAVQSRPPPGERRRRVRRHGQRRVLQRARVGPERLVYILGARHEVHFDVVPRRRDVHDAQPQLRADEPRAQGTARRAHRTPVRRFPSDLPLGTVLCSVHCEWANAPTVGT